MKKIATLFLLFSILIWGQENYEVIPIKRDLQGIKVVRIIEGKNIGLYGIIDEKSGELITKPNNILISVQKNHIYLVDTEYQEGLMTTSGKWIGEMGEYNYKEKYSNMYAKLEDEKEKTLFIIYIKDGLDYKYGYINLNGEIQIPVVYDEAENFSEGLAPVKFKNKWGYINEEGLPVIGFNFDEAYSFKNNTALVRIEDDSFYIDRAGNKKIIKSFIRNIKEWIGRIGENISSDFEGKFRLKQKEKQNSN